MASTGIVGSVHLAARSSPAVGPGWALAVDATTFGVSAFFLAQLRLPPHATLPPQSFLSDLRDGWHEFASRTWVWVIVLAASIGNMMTSIFVVLGAVIAKTSLGGARRVGGDPRARSVSARSLGGFVSLRVRVRQPLFFGARLGGFLALPMALLALHAPAALIAAGALLAGGGNMIFNSLWETTLQRHIPACGAVARQRVRLVRVARLPAARARDRRAGGGGDRHLDDALGRDGVTSRWQSS